MHDETGVPRSNSSLPVLPTVRIESPCSMNWDSMDGNASERFCGGCQKHVHNLSEMKAEDVNRLLGSGDNVCVKMRQRADGSILTKEDLQIFPNIDSSVSRRNWLAQLSALAAGVLAMLSIGCRDGVDHPVKMGEMSVPPTADAPVLMGEIEVMGGACANPDPTTVSQPQNEDQSGTIQTMMGKIALRQDQPPQDQPPQ